MSSTDKLPFLDGELTLPVEAFRTSLYLAQRLRYLMDDRLRADGLTTQQAALLTLVAGLGAPSLKQAAAGLGTTHQNVAQLVQALQRKGMLAVNDDPADGRRKLLSVTETSRAYWSSRDEGDHAAVAGWFAALSEEELRTFVELAQRILSALDPQ
ncbi:MarR family winged helix-turn-helix transcriptional regulator [Acrocarpospora catenulata]|uniref:MarR family winged helix-turn-helix transcriptional regulator n=1 Tax=Acrocarpospora catenulata TaxID=2836182 RepID=UPI001BDA05AE|nr:MarR family transcriptional regulator [Acrocarpospora catenulata]